MRPCKVQHQVGMYSIVQLQYCSSSKINLEQ